MLKINYYDKNTNFERYDVVEQTIKTIQNKTNCDKETAKQIYEMCSATAQGKPYTFFNIKGAETNGNKS
jgi:hypothetical protein